MMKNFIIKMVVGTLIVIAVLAVVGFLVSSGSELLREVQKEAHNAAYVAAHPEEVAKAKAQGDAQHAELTARLDALMEPR